MADSGVVDQEPDAPGVPRCDFCGQQAPRVRRIALDGEYERLRTPHQVQYACSDCSARKERERAEAGRA